MPENEIPRKLCIIDSLILLEYCAALTHFIADLSNKVK